jgi:hypothetical protein
VSSSTITRSLLRFTGAFAEQYTDGGKLRS